METCGEANVQFDVNTVTDGGNLKMCAVASYQLWVNKVMDGVT